MVLMIRADTMQQLFHKELLSFGSEFDQQVLATFNSECPQLWVQAGPVEPRTQLTLPPLCGHNT